MKYEVAKFENEDGEQIERLAMLIEGHDVQMVRFDGNDEAVVVKVDDAVRQMPMNRVNRFILTRLGVLMLLLAGCNTQYRNPPATVPVQQVVAIVTASPYPTVQPTATIDFMSTAVVAQATADEARRVNAIVTSQAEQRSLEQLQLTAQAEQRAQEVYAWTVTAALTSIPLTATQQAAVNTQIPRNQQIIAAQLTSTKEAPTQLVAMIDSQNHARFGKADYGVRMFALTSFGFFCIGLLVFLWRLPVPAKAQEMQQEAVTETVVQLKRETGGGDYSMRRLVIPCTPEQLTELAEAVISGSKTLGINNWEGKKTGLKRDVILRLRAFFREADMVTETSSKQLIPKDDLISLLSGWLDAQSLPEEYDFETPHSPEPSPA